LYGSYSNGGLNLNNANYIVPEDGIYRVGINVRTNKNQPGFIRMMLVVNNAIEDASNMGVSVIRNLPSENSFSSAVGSLVSMKKGDKMTIGFEKGNGGPEWSFHRFSSFSAVRVGDATTPGFHVEKADNLQSAGHRNPSNYWTVVNGFTASNYGHAFDNSAGNFDGSVFTASIGGVYAVESACRFDGAGGNYFRLAIVKNGDLSETTANINGYVASGMVATQGNGDADFYSLSVSGFVLMEKGDTIAVYAFGLHEFFIETESGFSAALLRKI
jgi:hypothetical protein